MSHVAQLDPYRIFMQSNLTAFTPLEYCQQALKILSTTPLNQWAVTFVNLKMQFSRTFTQGYIFSTRFGADFFQITEEHLRMNTQLKPDSGNELGVYDKNYNRWLSIACLKPL